MEVEQNFHCCSVVWRGQKYNIEINPSSTFKELGEKLQNLTNVEAHTLRLLVPVEKASKRINPFSDEYARVSLDTTSLLKAKSIIMMGLPKDEVDEVLHNAKMDLRIAGFDEEDKRLKLRSSADHRAYNTQKLPQGPYIFCDFRTLSLPGIELTPPASKALELMHKLASDPGVVAIMNKHQWRVGIMTELAPVGYVGVSPKCILGFNKNQGEEISLRLRTDDLKGFRKYESIKKTLLHELAHMVFSEHDTKFYALNKQLNNEAASLDWTKKNGHTLTGATRSQQYEEDYDRTSIVISSQKLGGNTSTLANARASSVTAALQRLVNASTTNSKSAEEVTSMPDLDVLSDKQNMAEPDPDDTEDNDHVMQESHIETLSSLVNMEVDSEDRGVLPTNLNSNSSERYDLDHLRLHNSFQPDQVESPLLKTAEQTSRVNTHSTGSDSNNSCKEDMKVESDSGEALLESLTPEPDPELQVIQDPVTVACARLKNTIQLLKDEVMPSEIGAVHQTLVKIISNLIEQPGETKFKKLRKANPMLQRNIVKYKAALEILALIGFCEDVIIDDHLGTNETFLVLKRNDPGLLWLAKSSLETYL